jgi:hypothetical protein
MFGNEHHFKKEKRRFKMWKSLFSILVFISTQAMAGACPDFTGSYKGFITNSNYLHNVQITQTGCNMLSVHEWGADMDFSYQQSLVGATATVDPKLGIVRTSSGYYDFTSLYISNSEVYINSPEWPETTLEVISKNSAGKLTISKLQGTAQYNELVSFVEE